MTAEISLNVVYIIKKKSNQIDEMQYVLLRSVWYLLLWKGTEKNYGMPFVYIILVIFVFLGVFRS